METTTPSESSEALKLMSERQPENFKVGVNKLGGACDLIRLVFRGRYPKRGSGASSASRILSRDVLSHSLVSQ